MGKGISEAEILKVLAVVEATGEANNAPAAKIATMVANARASLE